MTAPDRIRAAARELESLLDGVAWVGVSASASVRPDADAADDDADDAERECGA